MSAARLAALAILSTAACTGPADLVLRGGRVHSLRPEASLAQALALRDGRIAAVGSDADVARFIGPRTRVVELAGRPVYPGFADAHLHLAGLGRSLSVVDLVGTASYEQVVARALERAAGAPTEAWILGRGWDQNDWPETAFPHHRALSEALPDRPVVLTRVDGHALLANEEAMRRAGVSASTVAPPGGSILRDEAGQPTGVFVDNAMELVRKAVPPEDAAALRDGVARAIALLHRAGVTSVHDAGVSRRELAVYASMAREGAFDLRDYVMVSPEAYRPEGEAPDAAARATWLTPVEDVTGHGRLVKRAIKLSADGALGSRGASLLEPYSDQPEHRGLSLASYGEIRALAEEALHRGMQLCVHAIGDAANRRVLDAFRDALEAVPPFQRGLWTLARHPTPWYGPMAPYRPYGWYGLWRYGWPHSLHHGHGYLGYGYGSYAWRSHGLLEPAGPFPAEPRFRVEHAQVLHPDDLPRFAALGVIPSMQAQHQTSDMPWAERRLGPERVRGAYAWRSLLDDGVILPGGSDAPVERVDPIAAFHAAVTRSDRDGQPEGGWYPEQAMNRAEALAHITLWPAVASFQEHRMGSLAKGMLADLVVLSEDLTLLPAERMLQARVDLTVFDGRVVYER